MIPSSHCGRRARVQSTVAAQRGARLADNAYANPYDSYVGFVQKTTSEKRKFDSTKAYRPRDPYDPYDSYAFREGNHKHVLAGVCIYPFASICSTCLTHGPPRLAVKVQEA